MLHTGILPHHMRWERLFENLRYLVIDELHYYRGVFGRRLANVPRVRYDVSDWERRLHRCHAARYRGLWYA